MEPSLIEPVLLIIIIIINQRMRLGNPEFSILNNSLVSRLVLLMSTHLVIEMQELGCNYDFGSVDFCSKRRIIYLKMKREDPRQTAGIRLVARIYTRHNVVPNIHISERNLSRGSAVSSSAPFSCSSSKTDEGRL